MENKSTLLVNLSKFCNVWPSSLCHDVPFFLFPEKKSALKWVPMFWIIRASETTNVLTGEPGWSVQWSSIYNFLQGKGTEIERFFIKMENMHQSHYKMATPCVPQCTIQVRLWFEARLLGNIPLMNTCVSFQEWPTFTHMQDDSSHLLLSDKESMSFMLFWWKSLSSEKKINQ